MSKLNNFLFLGVVLIVLVSSSCKKTAILNYGPYTQAMAGNWVWAGTVHTWGGFSPEVTLLDTEQVVIKVKNDKTLYCPFTSTRADTLYLNSYDIGANTMTFVGKYYDYLSYEQIDDTIVYNYVRKHFRYGETYSGKYYTHQVISLESL